ncbi:MAG: hypothetical protein BalsKO_23460 [Balneolaceae bacterium]
MSTVGINSSKKKVYLIGLITVVFLTVFNQLLIQKVLSEQKFDATVINLAGKQRMLSQKIVKESYQVIEGAYELQRLKREVNVWDNTHKGLQEGDVSLGLPKLDSEHLQELFDELSPIQHAISTTILNADSSEQLATSLSIILENEQVFLPKMDEIVYVFEQ